MDWKTAGALAFGLVIGWYVYYVNRYRKGDVQIGDITTIIGTIGGGAVLALFDRNSDFFGAYAIGLAIGFFLYFLVLIILVGVSPNFDVDWFLDGRRRNPAEGYGYGTDARGGGTPMAPLPGPGGVGTTQIFNVGAAAPPAVQPVPAPRAAMALAAAVGPDPDDPARPVGADETETADFETARHLANVGAGPVEEPPPAVPAPAAPAAPAHLQVDVPRVQQFLNDCVTAHPRVTYGLGAKVPFHGAVPGVNFRKIDCSGFVREAIRLATNPLASFPDGSVVQHDWVRNKGFQRVTVADGGLNDNRVRIAFLRPQDVSSHIGHVVLLSGGHTFESHGGVGPDSRAWTGQGWQAKTFVYVLT
jgi:cell wall-associated NlpC family hydrolase